MRQTRASRLALGPIKGRRRLAPVGHPDCKFMESPEAFMLKFFAARNALFRRHQKESETFQREFCQGPLIYDRRLTGYDEERVLDATRQGARAEVTTNGNIKGRIAGRLRYEPSAVDGAWLVSDLRMECPICRGSGKFAGSGPACDARGSRGESGSDLCKVCKGPGWISTRNGVEGLLGE